MRLRKVPAMAARISDAELEQIRFLANREIEDDKLRRERALHHEADEAHEDHFILLGGFSAEPSGPWKHKADEPFSLSPIDNWPSQRQFQNASRGFSAYSTLRNLVGSNPFELRISRVVTQDPKLALTMGYYLTSILRAKSTSTFRACAYTSRSWNTISTAPPGTVVVNPMEDDLISTTRMESTGAVNPECFAWAQTHLATALEMSQDQSFYLALEALNTAPQLSPRNSIATSWAGIEAIFGTSQELSYRISMYGAVLLETEPDDRFAMQRTISKMYAQRSKAVHGDSMKEASIKDSQIDSWNLLAKIIVKIRARGEAPHGRSIHALATGRTT